MAKNNAVVLMPGKVYLDYGPISMVISAWQSGKPMTDLCLRATEKAVEYLQEISNQLLIVKHQWHLCKESELKGIALKMWQAVKSTDDNSLTSMAAVAGVMSDSVADWLVEQGATKVIVNNGGDIALRLLDDEETNVGIIPSLGSTQISQSVKVKSEDNIGGITTSGVGGRSFTQGIAESVTVFAKRCDIADAHATWLANTSLIVSDKIIQTLAKNLDPNSDIPEHLITVHVDKLTNDEIDKSLKQIEKNAQKAIEKGNIQGVVAHLQGKRLIVPENFLSDK